MLAPSPTPRSHGTSPIRGARRAYRRFVGGVIAAAALLVAGLAGRELVRTVLDLPPLPELARELAALSGPARPSVGTVLLNDPAAALTRARRAVVAANGAIDARALAYAAVATNGAVALLLLLLFARVLGRRALLFVAALLVAVFLAPTLALATPLSTWSAVQLALAFSVAQLVVAFRGRRGAVSTAVGLGLGVLAVAASSVGLASTLALAVGALSRRWREPGTGATGWRLPVALAVMLSGWVGWRGWHGGAPDAAPLLAGTAVVVALVAGWIPAFLAWGLALPAGRGGRRERLATLAGWAAALLTLAVAGGESRAALATAAAFGGVTLLAGWVGLFAAMPRARTLVFGLAAAWAVPIAVALLPARGGPPRDARRTSEQATILARLLRSGDRAVPLEFPGTAADRVAAETIVATPARALLPASLRAALPLRPADAAAEQVATDRAPEMKDHDALPIVSTWAPAGPYHTGEYRSAPLRTSFPVVQLRIAGTADPATAGVVLRTADGRELRPIGAAVPGPDRWRRVNFVAPAQPFQVVVRSTDASRWFAVTAPVEIGPVSRLLAKIPDRWPGWLLGFATAIGAAVVATELRRQWRRAAGRRSSIPWRVVPWLALGAYALYFSQHLDPTAGPNDSGGYLNSAKLLAAGHVTAVPRMVFGPAAGETDLTPYVPGTFHARGSRLVPEYPVGWPLEIATLGRLIGVDRAVRWLQVAHLVLGVLLTQRLARRFGLPDGWAWLGAGMVGLSPVYLFEGLQPVSDVPALVWVTAAIYAAWRGRDDLRWAAVAGLATALAVMIRPSDLLAVVPLVVCLGPRWRALAAWALAGVPGAVALAWYQHRLYGSWDTTGYGDVTSSLALRFVGPTLRSYALWLPEFLTPVVVLGLALPFRRAVPGRIRWVLGTWIAGFVAFYAVYWCTWDNWYNMRFVLPAFPALVIAALGVLRAATRRLGLFGEPAPALRPGAAGLLTAALVAALLGFGVVRAAERRVTFWMEANHKPGDAARWARAHLPADAVVLARHMTGSLFYYTDLTFVRLDSPAAQDPRFLERVRATGRPIYAVTCHWETRGFEWGHGLGSGYPDVPGDWQPVATLGEGEIQVWRRR